MMNSKRQTPQNRLKEKLYKIDFSENVDSAKSRSFDSKEFIRKANEVRKTFRNENTLFPESNY